MAASDPTAECSVDPEQAEGREAKPSEQDVEHLLLHCYVELIWAAPTSRFDWELASPV